MHLWGLRRNRFLLQVEIKRILWHPESAQGLYFGRPILEMLLEKVPGSGGLLLWGSMPRARMQREGQDWIGAGAVYIFSK